MATSFFSPYWDNHMHCCFSADSDASPEAMILAAKAKGLRGMTLTDHIDYDYPAAPDNSELIFEFDLDEYFKTIGQLSAKYSDEGFTVLCGLEIGLQPHLAPRYEALLENYSPDVVIGSTHVVNGLDPHYPEFFKGQDLNQAYLKYYEEILANLTTFAGIDTCGHLDYIFRYGPGNEDGYDSHSNYLEVVDAILEFLIKHDIALEINTGPFRSGMKITNPAPSILARYKELGGSLITLGADAHKPEHIALGFESLPGLLSNLGFKEFVTFKERKKILCPI